MSDAIAAAAATAASAGGQPASIPQPTTQQAARFEAILQEPGSYGAPVDSSGGAPAGLQTLVSDFQGTGADFRAQFLELENAPTTDYAALGIDPAVAAAFNQTEDMFHKTTHLSFSLFNFQLLTSIEHVTSDTMRTLYQQQG